MASSPTWSRSPSDAKAFTFDLWRVALASGMATLHRLDRRGGRKRNRLTAPEPGARRRETKANRNEPRFKAAVNLSFSFRTPSTS